MRLAGLKRKRNYKEAIGKKRMPLQRAGRTIQATQVTETCITSWLLALLADLSGKAGHRDLHHIQASHTFMELLVFGLEKSLCSETNCSLEATHQDELSDSALSWQGYRHYVPGRFDHFSHSCQDSW